MRGTVCAYHGKSEGYYRSTACRNVCIHCGKRNGIQLSYGTGAGKECDGQVLVSYDMIGLFSDYVPFFVKQYAEINKDIKKAVDQYVNEVREGEFPDENN